MPPKPKPPKPPTPPKAAIKKLADLQDQSLGLYQSDVRPWLLEMEAWDREHDRPVSAMHREGVRDGITNALHGSHFRTRHLRDKVQDETLLRPQAPPAEEPGFGERWEAYKAEIGEGEGDED